MNTILIIYVIVITVTFLSTVWSFKGLCSTPAELYECNNLNMFGCVFVYIVFVLLDPLLFVVKFLYWIFHTGREVDE